MDWLQESIKLKHPASEAIYRVSLPTSREPDAPSPSSKRTLRSMNHSFKHPEKPIKKKLFSKDTEKDDAAKSTKNHTFEEEEVSAAKSDEDDLIAQYSQENVAEASMPLPQNSIRSEPLSNPMASSTQLTANNLPGQKNMSSVPLQANPSDLTNRTTITIDYDSLDFFQGSSLYIDKNHFPEEFYTQMISECEAAKGNVVPSTFRDPVDYAIVSFETTLDPRRLPVKARHIVTELYVVSTGFFLLQLIWYKNLPPFLTNVFSFLQRSISYNIEQRKFDPFVSVLLNTRLYFLMTQIIVV